MNKIICQTGILSFLKKKYQIVKQSNHFTQAYNYYLFIYLMVDRRHFFKTLIFFVSVV